MPAVHLEKAAQLAAVVAAAEPIGTEHGVAPARGLDVLAHLVGIVAHVVGGGDDRAVVTFEALLDMAPARGFSRMQPVPAFSGHAVAAQFVVARRAPHVGDDAEVVLEQVGREHHFAQDGAAAHELHAMAPSSASCRRR